MSSLPISTAPAVDPARMERRALGYLLVSFKQDRLFHWRTNLWLLILIHRRHFSFWVVWRNCSRRTSEIQRYTAFGTCHYRSRCWIRIELARETNSFTPLIHVYNIHIYILYYITYMNIGLIQILQLITVDQIRGLLSIH